MKEDERKPDETYNKLAIKTEEREIESPEEEADENEASSLTQRENELSDLSDMQTAIKQLFPGDLGGQILNSLMIARVAPDVFIPLLKLLVNAEVRKSDHHKPIHVAFILSKIYTLLSIGLEGKGRFDHIELAGASKETEELEKLGKGLFG
tara:strand:+ start:4387 stop:4839 length:453 start_codon:yes stop_codon:yes gene_type:complete